MQVVYARCCGIDVHKKTVVACILTDEAKQTRTFGTMTADLLGLSDWLRDHQCQMVAMESTGVYWKPVYNVLEAAGIPLLVVNAKHIKAVPGRKTDVKDAEWIADLLRHGLLKPSFIPDRPQRELAELVRYRRSLIEERVREANRIQKVLEGANIKLASVISNVLGVSGRAMLDAIVAGMTEPTELAGQVRTRLQVEPAQLERALQGVIGAHQRLLLATQLQHVDFLSEQISQLDAAIAERLGPFEDAVRRLDTIPGVGTRTAQEIIAVIGTDMSRFPSHRHLASWAKLCPGTTESAGKHVPTSIGKGNPWLQTTLIEAAQAAAHTRDTYLAAQYHRLAARRGRKRAIVAVAHSILVIAYHLLQEGTEYTDLGHNYFDERAKEHTVRRATQRIQQLGYTVTGTPAA